MKSYASEFARDTEFQKLLRREEEVDLTVVCLELARDRYPDLDFAPTLQWVADRGADLARKMAHARDDRSLMDLLRQQLGEEFGLKGTRAAYDTPDGSYLNRVVEERTGLPISMSLLYMAVAQSAGISLQGVAAPSHFLSRYDTLDEPIFIDAFAGGRLLTLSDAVRRVQQATDASAAQARRALLPVGPRPIVLRMLNNLKALHARLQDWKSAYQVQRRLTALQPAVYAERRDLGLVALKSGQPGVALDLLNQCLSTCPSDERELLQTQISEAQRKVARWN